MGIEDELRAAADRHAEDRHAEVRHTVDTESRSGAPRDVTDAIAAATVVLLRDGPNGLETLMLRRSSRLRFAGGAWVFPGGRVDPDDYAPFAPDDVMTASRRAAVREAAEEAGLVPDVGGLVVLSHWMPPPEAPKRFSTWFFVAPAPQGLVHVDGGEINRHMWVRPGDALARRDAHEIELIPPTWVTLYRLQASPGVAAVLDDARAHEAEHFVTRAGIEGDTVVAMWHGDAGYGTGDASAPGARHRLRMMPSGWRYERTD